MRRGRGAVGFVQICLVGCLGLVAAAGLARAKDVGGGGRAADGPARPKGAAATAKPALDELRAIGKRVAREISEKNYASLYPLLCAADKAKAKPEAFANMLRELHKESGTKSAELVKDDEIVYENRRAGAKSAADLDKLQSVLVPIRLHFAPMGGGPGDSTSVQDWVFRREGGAWCTPLDD